MFVNIQGTDLIDKRFKYTHLTCVCLPGDRQFCLQPFDTFWKCHQLKKKINTFTCEKNAMRPIKTQYSYFRREIITDERQDNNTVANQNDNRSKG